MAVNFVSLSLTSAAFLLSVVKLFRLFELIFNYRCIIADSFLVIVSCDCCLGCSCSCFYCYIGAFIIWLW